MSNKTLTNAIATVIYFVASHLTGIVFILIGVVTTFRSNTKVSDMLNIWSFLVAAGTLFQCYFGLDKKISKKLLSKESVEDIKRWNFVINLAWMILSLAVANALNNLLWGNEIADPLDFNTNGLAIIAMGISIILLYHNYYQNQA